MSKVNNWRSIQFDYAPPKDIVSLKKRARTLRRDKGVTLSEAHEILARYCGYGSFHEAQLKMVKK